MFSWKNEGNYQYFSVEKKHFIKGYGNHILFLCPPTTIIFSADPVGISVATCLHSISLQNGQILAKLTQVYHWEKEKC